MACYNKSRHLLFVYGTLKSGQPNDVYLKNPQIGCCQLVGNACTELPYPLVIATEWNLPILLHAPGHGQKVQGEIYDIDDDCLKWLDDFEGHPEVYQRDRIKVHVVSHDAVDHQTSVLVSDGTVSETAECWVYYLKRFELEMLNLETFSSYDAYGSHNRKYVPSDDQSDSSNFEDALKRECSPENR